MLSWRANIRVKVGSMCARERKREKEKKKEKTRNVREPDKSVISVIEVRADCRCMRLKKICYLGEIFRPGDFSCGEWEFAEVDRKMYEERVWFGWVELRDFHWSRKHLAGMSDIFFNH